MNSPLRPLVEGDPQRLGDFSLLGRLGQGGFGIVYLGERGGQRAAVKVLHGLLSSEHDFTRRFEHEIGTLSRMRSSHVAELLDYDLKGRVAWLATTYVRGQTLDLAVSHGGPISGLDWELLASGLLNGLADIHRMGVIHRDIKPANVVMDGSSPRIIDFGIALQPQNTRLTATGHAIGTFEYMAPERFVGGEAPASDLFAAGATLAFAATGRTPFKAHDSAAVIHRILNGDPDLGDVAGPQRDFLGQLLRKEPTERPTAQQALDDLRHAMATVGATGGNARPYAPSTSPSATFVHVPCGKGMDVAQAARILGIRPSDSLGAADQAYGRLLDAHLNGEPHDMRRAADALAVFQTRYWNAYDATRGKSASARKAARSARAHEARNPSQVTRRWSAGATRGQGSAQADAANARSHAESTRSTKRISFRPKPLGLSLLLIVFLTLGTILAFAS